MLSVILVCKADVVESTTPSNNNSLKLAPKLGLNTLYPLLVSNQLTKLACIAFGVVKF